jgi:hypothetical protein
MQHAIAQPVDTIVVVHSGTSWWIPLTIAVVAAAASYCATWRMKRANVNRENAFRAAAFGIPPACAWL